MTSEKFIRYERVVEDSGLFGLWIGLYAVALMIVGYFMGMSEQGYVFVFACAIIFFILFMSDIHNRKVYWRKIK